MLKKLVVLCPGFPRSRRLHARREPAFIAPIATQPSPLKNQKRVGMLREGRRRGGAGVARVLCGRIEPPSNIRWSPWPSPPGRAIRKKPPPWPRYGGAGAGLDHLGHLYQLPGIVHCRIKGEDAARARADSVYTTLHRILQALTLITADQSQSLLSRSFFPWRTRSYTEIIRIIIRDPLCTPWMERGNGDRTAVLRKNTMPLLSR
jgi:hypothetical protein